MSREYLLKIKNLLFAVKEGIDYANKYYIGDVAATAEIVSFFNGYENSPNIDDVLEETRILLGENYEQFYLSNRR